MRDGDVDDSPPADGGDPPPADGNGDGGGGKGTGGTGGSTQGTGDVTGGVPEGSLVQVADALVDAERRIEARIAERVPPGLRRDLEHLLDETVDAGVTRFVWLRQFEPGSNSAAGCWTASNTSGASMFRKAFAA